VARTAGILGLSKFNPRLRGLDSHNRCLASVPLGSRLDRRLDEGSEHDRGDGPRQLVVLIPPPGGSRGRGHLSIPRPPFTTFMSRERKQGRGTEGNLLFRGAPFLGYEGVDS